MLGNQWEAWLFFPLKKINDLQIIEDVLFLH